VFTADDTLYGFQRVGRDRMKNRRFMLIVMHMGLGKTRTTLAAIEEMPLGRGIVICPAGVKYEWAREIYATTDQKGLVIDGPLKKRTELYSLAHHYKYVIMSYSTVLSDWAVVKKLCREFVVIDEATYLKGLKSKRSRAVKTLGRRAKARFGLSGQPVENRPEELFSEMEFINDEPLGRADIFDKTFIVRYPQTGKVKEYRNLHVLERRLSPWMYRKSRNDRDVAEALPSVISVEIEAQLDNKSAHLYKLIVQDVFTAMEESHGGTFDIAEHYGYAETNGYDASKAAQGRVMARVLALRMLCAHPDVLRLAGEKGTNVYATQLLEDGLLEGITASPKMDAVVDHLTMIMEEDPTNKVILFSFFKPLLRIVRDRMRGYDSVIYDGDMNSRQQDDAKTAFKRNKRVRLFLSSDAGGYGINLQEAQFNITYDQPWSSGLREQRNTRNVRLSSKFPSVVHVTPYVLGSVEVWMRLSVEQKQRVSEAVTHGQFDKSTGGLQMTVPPLGRFLRENSVVI
jgi:SNF2 family DNA or RNA helicase